MSSISQFLYYDRVNHVLSYYQVNLVVYYTGNQVNRFVSYYRAKPEGVLL